jgi:hypothetical protein
LTTGVATPAQADRLLAALLFPLSGRALGMLARDVTLAPSASVHDDTRPAGATQEIS